MVMFHSYVAVYQRVIYKISNQQYIMIYGFVNGRLTPNDSCREMIDLALEKMFEGKQSPSWGFGIPCWFTYAICIQQIHK